MRAPDLGCALRWWDAEVFADLASQNVRDLRVAGDRDSGAVVGIVPDRVVGAFALQRAPVAPHAPFELAALASEILGSLVHCDM